MKNLAVILICLFNLNAFAKEEKFSFSAAYNWADTFDIAEAGNFAKSGRLVGSWSWKFDNLKSGNTHFASTSFFRLEPYILSGLIKFNMWEIDNSERESSSLLMSYEGISTTADGVTKVKAKIVGGKGKYKNASGTANWTSINGFIKDGTGVIDLN